MRVNKWLLPALALALLLGTVGGAQALGLWQVSGREMVNLEQLSSGADVKGWMTLQQVADGSGLSLAALYAQLSLPASVEPQTALKELEGVVEGFETSVVREVVDEALGLVPAAGGEEAAPVGDTPAEVGPTVAEEAASAVATRAAAPAATATPTATPTVAHTPSGTGDGTGEGSGEERPAVTGAADIKGSHTLQEIADATGIDLAELLAALELPPETDPHTAVRELVASGLLAEVEEVRAAVAEMQ